VGFEHDLGEALEDGTELVGDSLLRRRLEGLRLFAGSRRDARLEDILVLVHVVSYLQSDERTSDGLSLGGLGWSVEADASSVRSFREALGDELTLPVHSNLEIVDSNQPVGLLSALKPTIARQELITHLDFLMPTSQSPSVSLTVTETPSTSTPSISDFNHVLAQASQPLVRQSEREARGVSDLSSEVDLKRPTPVLDAGRELLSHIREAL